MSSMEFNKIFGAILLAGLIAMLSGFVAGKLVEPEELEQNAYVVELPEGQTATAEAAAEPAGPEPIEALLASADPAAGQQQTRACAACHSFEQGGPNKVGPNLWNIVGAPHAHLEGYGYSSALASFEGNWDYEGLNQFLYNPKGYVPGTKMNYAGMKDTQNRANLIAYLRTLSDNPQPLPEAAPAEAAPAEEAPAEAAPAEAAPAEAAPAEETPAEAAPAQ